MFQFFLSILPRGQLSLLTKKETSKHSFQRILQGIFQKNIFFVLCFPFSSKQSSFCPFARSTKEASKGKDEEILFSFPSKGNLLITSLHLLQQIHKGNIQKGKRRTIKAGKDEELLTSRETFCSSGNSTTIFPLFSFSIRFWGLNRQTTLMLDSLILSHSLLSNRIEIDSRNVAASEKKERGRRRREEEWLFFQRKRETFRHPPFFLSFVLPFDTLPNRAHHCRSSLLFIIFLFLVGTRLLKAIKNKLKRRSRWRGSLVVGEESLLSEGTREKKGKEKEKKKGIKRGVSDIKRDLRL